VKSGKQDRRMLCNDATVSQNLNIMTFVSIDVNVVKNTDLDGIDITISLGLPNIVIGAF
jgi:hypothetical protein